MVSVDGSTHSMMSINSLRILSNSPIVRFLKLGEINIWLVLIKGLFDGWEGAVFELYLIYNSRICIRRVL